MKLLLFVMRTYEKVSVRGMENLPAEGPAIFVANHQSYLDIPTIGVALNEAGLIFKTYWVIGKDTIRNPYLRSFLTVAPVIVVNGTVKKASWALMNKYFIVVFPEGFYTWRMHKARRNGTPPPPRVIGHSAAILALKTGCPLIPIGIRGTEEAMPPYSFFAKPAKLSITIGEPFRFEPPEPEQVTEELIAEKSNFIIQRIDALR
ncbi:MAG: lysophospholipid acyltransferase family protein [Candidatus Omnitrophica bacterium]|nr:lysophospholipid acyltransferase family protein [Candidatus Omnitrophota bacterium]